MSEAVAQDRDFPSVLKGKPAQIDAFQALRDANEAMRPSEISEVTGRSVDSTNRAVRKLKKRGLIRKVDHGLYTLSENGDSEVSRHPDLENGSTTDDTNGALISYPLGRAGAGPGRISDNDTLTVDKRLIRSEVGYLPERDKAFWVSVDGESMEPWLKDGSYAFAVRQSEVTVPGRYVVWWGRAEAKVCCYLAKMSDKTLLLRKYGPEKEYELRHQDEDLYKIPNGDTVQVKIQGRIIWPPPTAKSVLETVTDQMGKVLEKALGES